MIRCSWSAISVNTFCVILPSVSVDCDGKWLVFEGFNHHGTIFFQLHVIFYPFFDFSFTHIAFIGDGIVRVVSLNHHSKIFDVLVCIGGPSSSASEVSVRIWTINQLLLSQIKVLSFENVRAFYRWNYRKCVAWSALFLKFDWCHLFSRFPVNFHLLKISSQWIIQWHNYLDVLRLVFHIIFAGSFQVKKKLPELILCVNNKSIFSQFV